MSGLGSFQNFPVDAAALTLWVFKKRVDNVTGLPVYTARWAAVAQELASEIKIALNNALGEITELVDYSLLAQNNESSALSLAVNETHADQVIMKASAETLSRKVVEEKHIQNAAFYAIKLTYDDRVMFAIRKTDASWRTQKRKDRISFFMKDYTLEAVASESFTISKYFDMFIVDGEILVKQKSNFESILSYKTAHKDEFVALQADESFKKIFVSLDELVKYVGDNKILLRRAAAIKQKGYYKNPAYLKKLLEKHKDVRLNLKFAKGGKIVITAETCKDVFQALLDFRLESPFSQNIYDVHDTAAVPT